ncbi:DUF3040 domain-containing protein [Streptomyces sp. NPDC003832]
MSASDDEKAAELTAVFRPDDPSFAHGPGDEHLRRDHRWGRAWLALAVALAAVLVGAVLPHGLLLAAGLVLSAPAVRLLESARGSRPEP